MKNLLYILLSITILTSCSSSKNNVKVDENKPSWINQNPISSFDYIGIGSASIIENPNNYREIAKRNALQDLGSEIEVSVKSNSMITTLESNASFDSYFQNYISVEQNQDLESYEMVSSYTDENSNTFWVYYKLSKSKWNTIVKNRKNKAIAKAKSLYTGARDLEAQQKYTQALKEYIYSFNALKKYLSDTNYVSINGEKIELTQKTYQKINFLLGQVKFNIEKKEFNLNLNNHFSDENPLKLLMVSTPMSEVVVKTKSTGRTQNYIADINGNVLLNEKIEDFSKTANNCKINIDLSYFFNNTDELIERIFESKTKKSFNVPITIEKPIVYIVNEEQNPSGRKYDVLKKEVKTQLNRLGILISDNKRKSNLEFIIKAKTTNSSSYNNFKSVDLLYTFSLKKTSSKEIANISESVKGTHSSYENAELEAYKVSTKKTYWEVKKLFSQLFL